jgi:catalase (peroxidase I)
MSRRSSSAIWDVPLHARDFAAAWDKVMSLDRFDLRR